ncbi:hypothetical protein [Phenylobacterium deserti]|uniref:Uncharacterized protein n=1 Tax=Phenylobacterium deserti TaxID=1914756 RepID=A0A328AC52_9CAUL|nr:hypothetical protein [Phenylobacterium deserti]RAK52322.1 hypothetical protein DJ018_14400 [Phenylobacterium deserti]
MASQFRSSRSRSFAPKIGRKPGRALPSRTLAPSPLPGAVVDAVLRFHDEVQDQGGGRSLLRLSDERLHDAEVEAALGDLAPRAARVSILWNEREGEIIRVLEDAANRLAA